MLLDESFARLLYFDNKHVYARRVWTRREKDKSKSRLPQDTVLL